MVLDLDGATSAKILSEDKATGRLVMSLPEAEVANPLKGSAKGPVGSWALVSTSGGAQLSIDLLPGSVVKRRFLLPPAEGSTGYRYVVDIQSPPPVAPTPHPVIAKTIPTENAKGGVVLTSLKATPRAKPVFLKKVVVIDAGHGGKDPGAHGGECIEKDFTLAAARALKDKLERTGQYRVVMTRDTDVYVPLDVRVQIARKADADLFISLHADSGPDEQTRGASVYTLADRAVGRSAKLVTKDDWFMQASYRRDQAVSGILFDLTQRSTKNLSANFAEMLLERISDEQTLLRRSHREAGLAVLLAPDVPAVLLEMGFITSPDDREVLGSAEGRTRLMSAVADTIDAYFARETRLAAR